MCENKIGSPLTGCFTYTLSDNLLQKGTHIHEARKRKIISLEKKISSNKDLYSILEKNPLEKSLTDH